MDYEWGSRGPLVHDKFKQHEDSHRNTDQSASSSVRKFAFEEKAKWFSKLVSANPSVKVNQFMELFELLE